MAVQCSSHVRHACSCREPVTTVPSGRQVEADPVPSQQPSSVPRTALEHPAGREQNEGAGGMDGDGCGLQLPREESLWLVFSGNLELGLSH